ncbi:MAG: metallophosphoesterase [Bacteroidales bacterium]|nr:metallophosphoesterase [Bacteroidales bacterium]
MKFFNIITVVAVILIVIIGTEYYSLKGLYHVIKDIPIKNYVRYIYWSVIPLLFIAAILNYLFNSYEANLKFFYINFLIASFFLLIFFPKFILASFCFIEDLLNFIFHLLINLINKFDKLNFQYSRFNFLSYFGFVLAIISFITIIYGHVFGRFHYQVNEESIYFNDLPKAFNSLRIVQISDLHIGNYFNNDRKLEKAVKKINGLNPDLILFTGDLVNNFADEVEPFIDILKELKGKYGKYSILGNHDYGKYFRWKSESDQKNNLEKLKKYHQKAGFILLLDENDSININDEKIRIIGMENWGKPPFPQNGDLNKAVQGINDEDFKILLSHDPSHWNEEVVNKTNINLTLSGHTHGMQFGIYTKKFKWSPVKWIYPEWGGLYKNNDQYLYVNVGLGNIGYLGRIGVRPEITLINLYKR